MIEIDADELASRLGEPGLVLLDVRSPWEYEGKAGSPSDPRQGHIPGARNVDVGDLLGAGSVEAVRSLVGEPERTEIIAYCHTGNRSALAAEILQAAGYRVRNYAGSWYEWSRRGDLPAE